MNITKTNDPKNQLVPAVTFGLLGAVCLFIYWDGFIVWLRICSLSYEEVKNTPFVPIWTSARGVAGILFIIAGLHFFSTYLQLKKAEKIRHDSAV
ncbi:MAG: hypothetical protein ACR2H1_05680 [Limisphaerales bacterium]